MEHVINVSKVRQQPSRNWTFSQTAKVALPASAVTLVSACPRTRFSVF